MTQHLYPDTISQAYELSEHEAQRGRRMENARCGKPNALCHRGTAKIPGQDKAEFSEGKENGGIVHVQDPKSSRWDSTARIIEKRS